MSIQKIFVRINEVVNLTGIPKSTIYQWTAQGKFPRQIKLGERVAAWRLQDVEAWAKNPSTWSPMEGGQDDER